MQLSVLLICLFSTTQAILSWDQSKTQTQANERNDGFIRADPVLFQPGRLPSTPTWTVPYNQTDRSQLKCFGGEMLFANNLVYCVFFNTVFAINPSNGRTAWRYTISGVASIQYFSIAGGISKATNGRGVVVVDGIQIIVLDSGTGALLADKTVGKIGGTQLSGVPITTQFGEVISTLRLMGQTKNRLFDFDVTQDKLEEVDVLGQMETQLVTFCGRKDGFLAVSDLCGFVTVFQVSEANGKKIFAPKWKKRPPCGEGGYAYSPPICITDPIRGDRLLVSAGSTKQCRLYDIETNGTLLNTFPCAFSPLIGYTNDGVAKYSIGYSGQIFEGLVVSQIVGNDIVGKQLFSVSGVEAFTSIVGDYLFTVNKDRLPLVLECYELSTGKMVWSYAGPAGDATMQFAVGGVQGLLRTYYYVVVATDSVLLGFRV